MQQRLMATDATRASTQSPGGEGGGIRRRPLREENGKRESVDGGSWEREERYTDAVASFGSVAVVHVHPQSTMLG
jgi:hypothetical protein